jgi:ferritin-like metal-binding protein YciE
MLASELEILLNHELLSMYDTEHRFLEVQYAMLNHASDNKLKKLIQERIDLTEWQITNLEQVYSLLGQQPKRIQDDAATGLVIETQKMLREASDNSNLLDSFIAGALFKFGYYTLACYRGLVTSVTHIGQRDVLQLLRQNLQQEQRSARHTEKTAAELLSSVVRAASKNRRG